VTTSRTLQAAVDAAVDATAAGLGWLLAPDGTDLLVVAASGDDPALAAALVGRRLPAGVGTASYALQSGQPVALSAASGPAGGDEGARWLLERDPASVVCVPCGTDDATVGVLEIVDKAGGAAFSFDDVEVVTLLAGVAGAALAEGGGAEAVPEPARLGAELTRLAQVDPGRYATVAPLVAALLS
jgi:GAF domain-containing protein